MKKSDIKDITIRSMDQSQPSCPKPADTDSVGAVAPGRSVSFPGAADTTSAGGAKTTTTLVEKTGSAVKFPDAADTKSAGGVKMTDSFANC